MSRLVDRVRGIFHRDSSSRSPHFTTSFSSERHWLDLPPDGQMKLPHELESIMPTPPPSAPIEPRILDCIQGSMIGMAIGDAMGAHVEFRPYEFLRANPVRDLQGGGTWGLNVGQFTDDTSMALCLAASLIVRRSFSLYDQLVRYKWWFRHGYMSSTGKCFDIGTATRESLQVFENRQKKFVQKYDIRENVDFLSDTKLLEKFEVNCSRDGVAGNGALMRLAPIPLFFYQNPVEAVKYCGLSAKITHGDQKAVDACRYYGALIVAALRGAKKEQLLDAKFYSQHKKWFEEKKLCPEIERIANGSFRGRNGYADGIRGSGYIVNALEAALWAFWSDGDSFENGVLKAVNLGDDTDTTAAIYGQLAGAFYGYRALPERWVRQIYAKNFILNMSKWIAYEGNGVPSTRNRASPTKRSPVMNGSAKPILAEYSSENSSNLPNGLAGKKSNESQLRKTNSTPSREYPPLQQRRIESTGQNFDEGPTFPTRPPNPLRRTEVFFSQPSADPSRWHARPPEPNPMNFSTVPILRTQEPPAWPVQNGGYPLPSHYPARPVRGQTAVVPPPPPPVYRRPTDNRVQASTASSRIPSGPLLNRQSRDFSNVPHSNRECTYRDFDY